MSCLTVGFGTAALGRSLEFRCWKPPLCPPNGLLIACCNSGTHRAERLSLNHFPSDGNTFSSRKAANHDVRLFACTVGFGSLIGQSQF